jgi:hypothetical protein
VPPPRRVTETHDQAVRRLVRSARDQGLPRHISAPAAVEAIATVLSASIQRDAGPGGLMPEASRGRDEVEVS